MVWWAQAQQGEWLKWAEVDIAREMGNVGTIKLRWAAYGMRVGNMGRWGLTLLCLT